MTTERPPIDVDRTVAAFVEEAPELARVFESFGIDFCCNGDRPLADACAAESVDVDAVGEALAEARGEGSPERTPEWETPAELVHHIVARYHEPTREELSALEGLVRNVRRVHGENHPELSDVEREFDALAAEMREHTAEEESEVFPVIEKLDAGESVDAGERETLRAAIDDLEDDHEETAERLERLSELTDGYAVPPDACTSYRSMLERLHALERDTYMHVHKENNVLFPAVEERLLA